MEWRHSGSHRPKKFKCKYSLANFSSRFFEIKTASSSIIIVHRKTINKEYFPSLLVQLKDIMKGKRRGKFSKGFLFLHHNAPAHLALETLKKLAYLGFQCLDQPA